MGFRDSLKMLDVRSFLNASARKVLLYVVGDDDGTYTPVTESMLAGGGSGGGGGSDPASAREVTLGQVRDAVGTLATQAGAEGLHLRPSAIVTIHPAQALTVNATVASLDIPATANAATVHVISGAVRRSIGGTPSATTPALNVGDSEEIQGAELYLYRLIREGSSDALVYVEYRTVS